MSEEPSKKKSKYDSLTPEQIADYEAGLKNADGVSLYRSAGGIGQGQEYAQLSNSIYKAGGIDPQVATDLARYRMWKNGIPVPEGPPVAWPGMPAQIDARNAARAAAPVGPERDARIDADNADQLRAQELFYDHLASSPPAEQPPPAIAAPTDEPPPAIAAPIPQQQPGPMLASNDAMGASDRRVKTRVTSGDSAAQDFLSRVNARGAWPKSKGAS